MLRTLAAACTLLVCASLVTGCGGSHRNTLASRIADNHGPAVLTANSAPPRWLAKIVGRVARVWGHGNFHTIEYHFGKHTDAAEMFGRFETPPPKPCTTSYCPVPVRVHGWNLRLVVSKRTHRILSARIGQRITHAQAPEIAWHANRDFHIFPRAPGTVSCKIPRGGSNLIRRGGTNPRPMYLGGRCTTSYVRRPPSPNSGKIRIRFIEVWSPSGGASGPPMRAGWVVTVGPTGHVNSAHRVIGEPPQAWK
jgi:hypothetical protein